MTPAEQIAAAEAVRNLGAHERLRGAPVADVLFYGLSHADDWGCDVPGSVLGSVLGDLDVLIGYLDLLGMDVELIALSLGRIRRRLAVVEELMLVLHHGRLAESPPPHEQGGRPAKAPEGPPRR